MHTCTCIQYVHTTCTLSNTFPNTCTVHACILCFTWMCIYCTCTVVYRTCLQCTVSSSQ